MKKVNQILLTIMMVMVSTFALANGNDPKVKIEKVDAKTITVIAAELAKAETEVQLRSEDGSSLYRVISKNNEKFVKRFDLNALPAGNYALEVENQNSFTTTPVVVGEDSASVLIADQVTIVKPVLVMKGEQLDVILPQEARGQVLITIYDRQMNKLAIEPIESNMKRVFDLSKLSAGDYTVKMETKGRNFIQSVSLNK